MADSPDLDEVMEADGVTVCPRVRPRIACLRYFDRGGEFAAGVAAIVGVSLPEPGRCVRHCARPEDGAILLASCNPTTTLAVFEDAATLGRLEEFSAGQRDGSVVDLTGGMWACDIKGTRAADLLARIGADARMPEVAEARTSRLADLSVTSVCIDAGTVTLLVDRVYANHLCAWIRATLEDFTTSGAPD